MKLHILSDVHVEFEHFDPPQTDADVVILAGDIHLGYHGLAWAEDVFPDKPVIYVPGNHEYYREAIPKHTGRLKESAKKSNVHILEQDSLTLDGVTFLGCTLWTDFELFGDPRIAGYEADQRMTDYQIIRVSPEYRKLRAVDTAAMHHRARRWLEKELDSASSPVVVITHHAPSKKSVSSRFRDDILSAAYASNLDEFVSDSGAQLWIHGHLHSQSDYRLGDTRVLCNPRGYPDEPNAKFDPGLVVSVAD